MGKQYYIAGATAKETGSSRGATPHNAPAATPVAFSVEPFSNHNLKGKGQQTTESIIGIAQEMPTVQAQSPTKTRWYTMNNETLSTDQDQKQPQKDKRRP